MRPWVTREMKYCKGCGEPIIWQTNSDYCTMRCKQAVKDERRLPECTRCGKRIHTGNKNRHYCDDCRIVVSRERALAHHQKKNNQPAKPAKKNTLPPDSDDHQKAALQRFRERQAREASFDTGTKPARRAPTLAAAGSKPSEAALHRSEALTGACGAVSYGSRQAGSKACE